MAVLAGVTLTLVAGACGGDADEEGARDVERTNPSGAAQPPQPTSPAQGTTTPQQRPKVIENPDGSHTFVNPNGSSYTKPPAPKRTEVEPGEDCDRRPPAPGEPRGIPPGPPRPGLRAAHEGDAVRVFYDLGDPPDECRPTTVLIGVTTSTGPEIGRPRSYEVSDLSGSYVIEVPDYWNSRPDTAYAGSASSEGVSSETSKVRIR